MTSQLGDRLVIRGREVSASECIPLRKWEGIARVSTDEAHATLPHVDSTACWRGYQAFWRMEADRLLLTRLLGYYTMQSPEPLVAEWISGPLVMPLEDVSTYAGIHNGPPFPARLLIEFDRGRVLSQRELDFLEDWRPVHGRSGAVG